MKKLISKWFGTNGANPVDLEILKLRKSKEKSDRELETLRKRFERLERQMEKLSTESKQALDRAAGLNKKLVWALDAKELELLTANEVVIPSLVSANSTFKESWDAQSSLDVMRQTAIKSSKDPQL